MAQTRFCEIGRTAGNLEVASKGSGTIDGWTSVVTLPGSILLPNHTYAFVYVCNAGSFRGFQPTSPPTAQRAEISIRKGGSTYLSPALQTMDPLFAPWTTPIPPFEEIVEHVRGGSFMYVEWEDVGATPGDYEIIARVFRQDPQASPAGQFIVNEPVILAFDLTTIDAEPQMTHAKVSNVTQGNILPNAAPQLRNTLVLPESGSDWLIFHYARFRPTPILTPGGGGANVPTRIWLQDSTGSMENLELHNRILMTTHGSSGVPHYSLGQCTFARDVTNLTLEQYSDKPGQSVEPLPSVWFHGKVLAIKMATQFAPFVARTEPAPDFWANHHESIPVDGEVIIASPSNTIFGFTASADVNWASHFVEGSIDGGLVNPAEFYILPEPQSSIPINAFFQVVQEVGEARIRLRGRRNPLDRNNNADPPLPLQGLTGPRTEGHDCRFLGFTQNIGVIIPDPPGEVPGPILPIVPDRETTVVVSSLPVLPLDPSYAIPVRDENVRREFRTPRGDLVVHPKFIKGRRVVRFGWTNRNAADAATLLGFFDELLTDHGGTFAYQMPGDASAVPWTLFNDRYGGRRAPDGHHDRIEFEAIELVWFLS